MPALDFRYDHGGLFFPRLGLWLDAHLPQSGPERVFVSHAHADHIADHREIIATGPTASFIQARIGGNAQWHLLAYGEPRKFPGSAAEYQMTLLPAGHIFGSAMCLLECAGESLLYTGDFKLRPGLSAEPCQPRTAQTLIMETTYGRPEYRFPPTTDILRGIVRFCREALDNDETAVLLGYSLGKSQELLCSLGDARLPLMLHGQVFNLTRLYEEFGQCFPPYERYDSGSARGKVLLCPPSITGSRMLKNLGPARVAVLTGWAVDANCKYRYQADAAFPLSDHADFPDLLRMVETVQPRQVYTLHGFAADFAQTLRERNVQAQALSQEEQFVLALPAGAHPLPSRPGASPRVTRSAGFAEAPSLAADRSGPAGGAVRDDPALSQRSGEDAGRSEGPGTEPFSAFAEACAAIAQTPRKLEKIQILAAYFRSLTAESAGWAAVWFTGHPFPPSANKVLQVGWAQIREAVCVLSEATEDEFNQIYLKHSDLGETAFELLESHDHLTGVRLRVGDVRRFFEQVCQARGPRAKGPLLVAGLHDATALEAKFLIKIFTSDLRIGLKEGLVEEAIAAAYGHPLDVVKGANLLLGDMTEVASRAHRRELEAIGLVPFRPVKFMLASPEESARDVWDRVTEWRANRPAESAAQAPEPPPPPTAWLEDKYDGIRCQLHKVGIQTALYSRDLKNITATFHDIAEAAGSFSGDLILDGEILAMRGDQVLPFADLQKRLGRRQEDLFLRDELPVQFVAFDFLWRNGDSLLRTPLSERRAALEALAPFPPLFRLARITQAASEEAIEEAFGAARARDNEGLMIKDPASHYTPGRRGLSWLKLKKATATLDCIVVGAEYGHGKRKNVLSDYTFAVRDELTGELKTIGKAYSGLTDVEIAGLTRHFLGKVIRQHGRYHEVEPEVVLEIAFDRLQRSSRHNSGLAMRFPRIVRIRTDKTIAEIDTLQSARRLVK